jgi:hypothetical protein
MNMAEEEFVLVDKGTNYTEVILRPIRGSRPSLDGATGP